MTARIAALAERMDDGLARGWHTLRRRLGLPGRDPWADEDDPALLGAMGNVLRPVGPSNVFRETLRENLAFAAQRRMAGLVVEVPRPMREGLVLGILAGVLLLTGLAAAACLRWRRASA